ncbi:MAG: ABC transporter ATP-binding protein [Cyclobacteriaceae bacterium]
MPPLLEVQNLKKQHENSVHPAVQDISFSLQEGEILSLTGESGSGKTTLLKLISGLLEADEGKVYLDGEWVKGPSRRLVPGHPDIKMVYQHYELSPNLNVRNNIAHILRAYETDYREQRVEELLRICRLTALAERYPRELSGGERQRVALARAIAEEPRLLLMDEPFSNIDIGLKNHLKQQLLEILEELQITTIIVTHDPQDALSMAAKVAVMQGGHMLQMAPPRTVYRAPVNAYVASLFGPCNFLEKETAHALQLSVDTSSAICLRAEDIRLSRQAPANATVKKVRYMGAFQEVIAEIQGQLLQILHQDHELRIGEGVQLSVLQENVIQLPKEVREQTIS